MSLESDIRTFLAEAATSAGEWIYYNSAPQDAPSRFITIKKVQDDPQFTTDPGPGHRNVAVLEILCSAKGSDVFTQYEAATTLAEAVKTKLNTIGAMNDNHRPTFPFTVGASLIYFCSFDSAPDTKTTEGTTAPNYQYQKGAGSGIQAIKINWTAHYWNPNS